MLDSLLSASLRNRGLVVAVAVALTVVGAYRASRMPVDVFPDLTAPRVTVVTESTGMASEEIEQLITYPIESAVNGTAGLRRVRSASAAGISVVWAEFDWATPETVARQRVTERLQSMAGSLPPEASAPLLMPSSSVMGEILFVALTSEHQPALSLRRIAEVDVRRRLLAVEGISQVVPIGGYVKQYQVLVEPVRVHAFGLTLHDVVEALREGSLNAPGGYVVDGGQESVIRVLGRASSVEDLGAVIVALRDKVPVRVRDLATVQVGKAVARGAASYNATPAVLLSVVKQPTADTLKTTARLDRALDGIEADLRAKKVKVHRDVFRQRDFIDTAISNVTEVLRDGSLLVALVLLVFLWSLRPTVISLLALPLSVLAATLSLDLLGLRLDTMTLGGLAIAIGELVDDAIVDVENVARRLRERARLPEGERPPVLTTVRDASLEIRSAIVSATWVLMLVFVPLLLLDGLEGRLLRPLAIAYLVSIFASLIVAVTVTPVLCSWLLPSTSGTSQTREPPVIRWLVARYARLLDVALRHPRAVVLATLCFVLCGVAGLSVAGRSFLPEFNEGSLTINMVVAPGTSLPQSDALATMAERALLEDQGVLAVGRRTGRAERDEHVLGVETTEMEVRVRADDPRTRQQLFSDIRQRLQAVPAQFNLGQPISHRIEHMMSGQRAALAIKVYGSDLRQLRRVAQRIKQAISQVPGVVDLNVEQIVNVPQLSVRVRASAAANYGLSKGQAARAIGTALWGSTPTRVFEQNTTTDVVVKYPPQSLLNVDALAQLRLPTPAGALVPVSALADVVPTSSPNYILRENVQRRIVVSANVSGASAGAVSDEVRRTLSESLRYPEGVHVELSGQFARQERSRNRLYLFGLLALLGIGFLVTSTLGSVRRALIVLVNLPLAFSGGVLGVYLAGGVLSIATTIGFITLFGIATRNGILLATRVDDLEAEGLPRMQASRKAAHERLAPILMTATSAALGLLPLGLALGQPGSEIQAPMALVILTGLSTSTLLNMLVVPALIGHWGGTAARQKARASVWPKQALKS